MTHTISKVAAATLTAAVALTAFTGIAFAERGGWDRGGNSGDETKVENSNEANVTNNVTVKAYTGDNESEGGDGDDGGNGGNADADGDNATANGGSGGNGGRGGNGGTIITGDATAWGTVNNDVNRNNTHIEGCGCDDEEAHGWMSWFKKFNKNSGDEVDVENKNRATLVNDLYVKAETGDNESEGGDGDDGGNGGDADADGDDNDGKKKRDHGWKMWFNMMHGDDDDDYATANGGHGGNGGNGAEGGYVETGEAYADGLITNTVNRNVTRITR